MKKSVKNVLLILILLILQRGVYAMTMDSCLVVECPRCGGTKELLQLCSGNTFGAVVWSDTKQIAPMLPCVSPVQKCAKCAHYYLLGRAKTKNGNEPSVETGWPTFDEMLAAHKDLTDLSNEEKTTVAVVTVWAYNDIVRAGKTPTEEQTAALKNYLLPVLQQEELFSEKLFVAELYRETGEFDRCLKALEKLDPKDEFVKKIADEIKKRARARDRKVFSLNALQEKTFEERVPLED